MSRIRMSLYRQSGGNVSWIIEAEGSRGSLVVSAQVNNNVVVQRQVFGDNYSVSGVLNADGQVYYRATLRDWGMGAPAFIETDGFMEIGESSTGSEGEDQEDQFVFAVM